MILWYMDEAGINADEVHVAVGGFGIHDLLFAELTERFKKFKVDNLKDPSVKMDMKRIMQGKDWARRLSLQERQVLLNKFWDLIEKAEMRICISYINRDYSPKIRNKLQFAFECLFERLCLNTEEWARDTKRPERGLLFLDYIAHYKEVLSWFHTFFQDGTGYVRSGALIERAVPLRMSDSELLQIADIIVSTYTYDKKARAGQKSIQWAREVLDRGVRVIHKKAPSVKDQTGKKVFSSIKEYSF